MEADQWLEVTSTQHWSLAPLGKEGLVNSVNQLAPGPRVQVIAADSNHHLVAKNRQVNKWKFIFAVKWVEAVMQSDSNGSEVPLLEVSVLQTSLFWYSSKLSITTAAYVNYGHISIIILH